jgi:hypothetical protein
MTAENMARRRAYRRDHPHPESPESRKKSNRKYRISSYGLTQEQCIRGLLCHTCNIALGHIECRYEMARAYLLISVDDELLQHIRVDVGARPVSG